MKRDVAIGSLLVLALGASVGRADVTIRYKAPVRTISYSSDGKILAVGCGDGKVHFLDPKTGKETRSFSLGGAVYGVAISQDGKWLGVRQEVTSGSPPASIIDIQTGAQTKKLSQTYARYVTPHLGFTPDGGTLMGAGPGARMMFRHLKGGASASGNQGDFAGCAENGSMVALGRANGYIALYSLQQSRGSLQVGPSQGLALSPEGKVMAVAQTNKSVTLWNVNNRSKIGTIDGLKNATKLLSFSGDGKLLGGYDATQRILHIWDVESRRLRRQVPIHQRGVHKVLLSKDGRFVVTATPDQVRIWRATPDLTKLEPIELGKDELEPLWVDLVNPDFDKTDRALRKLAAGKKVAVPFLRKKVREVAVPNFDEARLQQLLTDLDNDSFDRRESAQEEIAEYGELARIPLEKLLETTKSAEVIRRVKVLMKELEVVDFTPDRQRVQVSLDLLEQLGTPSAREVLDEIARDATISAIRLAATEALERSKASPKR